MNIEKYTQNAQSAVMDSQNVAISMGHQMLDGEHIHMALMMQKDGLIPRLLQHMKVESNAIIMALRVELDKIPKVSGGVDGIYSSRRFSKLMMRAEEIAEQFKDEYVSVEHIYLALLEERGTPSSKILERFGITNNKFLEALSKVRGNQRVTNQNPENTYDVLKKYGSNLTDLARIGKIDPVIGRDDEIESVVVRYGDTAYRIK